jgi:metalloendopeptidase OMA1, mitochondrial
MLGALAGCVTVPISGRRQLVLLPESLWMKQVERDFLAFRARADRDEAVVVADSDVDMVTRVARRVIDASAWNRLGWEALVVRNARVNAVAFPNGKIVLFHGMIAFAKRLGMGDLEKTEAVLAVVIGHEVAHVVARHGLEQWSQEFLVRTAGVAVDEGLGAGLSTVVGMAAQYGVLLPFSRMHELEADRLGLMYMANAGYDPAVAIDLWAAMEAEAAERSGVWEYLATHPSPGKRRVELEKSLPEAKRIYADRTRLLSS